MAYTTRKNLAQERGERIDQLLVVGKLLIGELANARDAVVHLTIEDAKLPVEMRFGWAARLDSIDTVLRAARSTI